MELLKVVFKGWTATPRLPQVKSGKALSIPIPSYSTLLGLIGCCLGREVSPSEVRIGFEYRCDEQMAIDLETTHRLAWINGKIKPHPKGTAVTEREFHINPELIMFVDAIHWQDAFLNPVGIPCLGRSQDLLWITQIERITATPVKKGILGPTLIPFAETLIPGRMLRLCESYKEGNIGEGRQMRHSGLYTAVSPYSHPIEFNNLYDVGPHLDNNRVLYFHQWEVV